MSDKVIVQKSRGGIGIGTILFLIFLFLKLTGNIAWSWWWVTAPLWIPISLIVGILFIFCVIAFLAVMYEEKSD